MNENMDPNAKGGKWWKSFSSLPAFVLLTAQTWEKHYVISLQGSSVAG
jgi:hypothetical protein